MNNDEFDKAVGFLQGALDIATEEAAKAATPPPDTPAAKAEPASPRRASGRRLTGRFIAAAVIAVATGVAVALTLRLAKPRIVTREVVKEVKVQVEPDGVPLALLPDTADASVWETVANMSGTVGGTTLQFKRGIATANGITYKVCLDFCRSGSDVYVRVTGPVSWVARVSADGRIVRTYPAPRSGKPLKALFGS